MSKGTRQVAQELGIRPATLLQAVWQGRVPAPPKSAAGNYLWRPEDVARAAKLFQAPRHPRRSKSRSRSAAI